MQKISELTYKMIAYSEFSNFDTDECIDWAIEMLELGYKSEFLSILSVLSKPSNYFETIEYLKIALDDIRIKEKSGDDAIISYSAYHIIRIRKSENIQENLEKVFQICCASGMDDNIFDFYLLYWAWDDFFKWDSDFSHYWDGATKENIKEILVMAASKWLKEYKKRYCIEKDR